MVKTVESVDFVGPGWYGIISVDDHREGTFLCSFDEAEIEDMED